MWFPVVKHTTKIRHIATESRVLLQDTECSGFNSEEDVNTNQVMNVSLRLANPEGKLPKFPFLFRKAYYFLKQILRLE
jgi:hypothetical protein